MTHRRLAIPVLVAALWVTACKKEPPPPVTPVAEPELAMLRAPDPSREGRSAIRPAFIASEIRDPHSVSAGRPRRSL